MGFLYSSIRSSHNHNETHTDTTHTEDFIRTLSRVPTHTSYDKEPFHDHFDKKETVTATLRRKKKRKKRDILRAWFHRENKGSPVAEKRPTTPVGVLQSYEDIEEDLPKPQLDTQPREEVPETKTEEEESPIEKKLPDADPFDDSPKYLSFRALFKRKRNQSFVNEFEDIGSLKRSKTLRERFFGVKTQREVTTLTSDVEKEQETTVYDVSETLTQRYMNNNYDKLVEDMDAIPFDLKVEEQYSVRTKMSQLFQSLSPAKLSPLKDPEGLESDNSDDELTGSWNPYTKAKRNCAKNTVEQDKVPLLKKLKEEPTITPSGRFGTLKRSVTRIIFRANEQVVVDDDDASIKSYTYDNTRSSMSMDSLKDPAVIFNTKRPPSAGEGSISSLGTLNCTPKLLKLSSSSSQSRFCSAGTITVDDLDNANRSDNAAGFDKFEKSQDSDKFEKWFNGGHSEGSMSGTTKCTAKTSTGTNSEAFSFASTIFMTPLISSQGSTLEPRDVCGVTPAEPHIIPVELTLKPQIQRDQSKADVSHCPISGIEATVILNKGYDDGQPQSSDSSETNVENEQFFESVRDLIKTNKERQREEIRGYPRKHQYLESVGTVRYK